MRRQGSMEVKNLYNYGPVDYREWNFICSRLSRFTQDAIAVSGIAEGNRQAIHLWHVTDYKKPFFQLQSSSVFSTVEFTPEDAGVISGSTTGVIKTWDLVNKSAGSWMQKCAHGEPEAEEEGEAGTGGEGEGTQQKQQKPKCSVTDLRHFNCSASVFLSCGTDGTVKIWDQRQDECALQWRVGEGAGHPLKLEVAPREERLIACGTSMGQLEVMDLRSSKLLMSVSPHFGSSVSALAFHPVLPMFAAACNAKGGGVVQVDCHTQDVLPGLETDPGSVRALAYSKDGTHLISVSTTSCRLLSRKGQTLDVVHSDFSLLEGLHRLSGSSSSSSPGGEGQQPRSPLQVMLEEQQLARLRGDGSIRDSHCSSGGEPESEWDPVEDAEGGGSLAKRLEGEMMVGIFRGFGTLGLCAVNPFGRVGARARGSSERGSVSLSAHSQAHTVPSGGRAERETVHPLSRSEEFSFSGEKNGCAPPRPFGPTSSVSFSREALKERRESIAAAAAAATSASQALAARSAATSGSTGSSLLPSSSRLPSNKNEHPDSTITMPPRPPVPLPVSASSVPNSASRLPPRTEGGDRERDSRGQEKQSEDRDGERETDTGPDGSRTVCRWTRGESGRLKSSEAAQGILSSQSSTTAESTSVSVAMTQPTETKTDGPTAEAAAAASRIRRAKVTTADLPVEVRLPKPHLSSSETMQRGEGDGRAPWRGPLDVEWDSDLQDFDSPPPHEGGDVNLGRGGAELAFRARGGRGGAPGLEEEASLLSFSGRGGTRGGSGSASSSSPHMPGAGGHSEGDFCRGSGVVSDASVSNDLKQKHKLLIKTLQRRLVTLRQIRDVLKQGDVFGAVTKAIGSFDLDPGVLADFLHNTVLPDRRELFSLSHAAQLLPFVRKLIESDALHFVLVGTQSASRLCNAFSEIIRASLRRAGGEAAAKTVDVALDERVRRAQACYDEFRRIYMVLMAANVEREREKEKGPGGEPRQPRAHSNSLASKQLRMHLELLLDPADRLMAQS